MTTTPNQDEETSMEFTFGEPEETTVRDLRVGDFVVQVPSQAGVRGVAVNSGVKRIIRNSDPEWARGWGEWRQRVGYGRAKFTAPSSMLTFLSGTVGWHFPDDFTVTVRRLEG